MLATDDILSQQTCRWTNRHNHIDYYSSCTYGSWVMFQIVLKWKFFIKWLSQEPPYIKLLFKIYIYCITLMFKTYCKIIDKIILQSYENQSVGVKRPYRINPSLINFKDNDKFLKVMFRILSSRFCQVAIKSLQNNQSVWFFVCVFFFPCCCWLVCFFSSFSFLADPPHKIWE